MKSLKEIEEHALNESARRGFRSLGIYHLLWDVHKLQPNALTDLLERYQVETVPFIKMLENTLRPRRAGGGIPRDRLEATLHFLLVLPQLEEDPIASLCDRFALSCTPPE